MKSIVRGLVAVLVLLALATIVAGGLGRIPGAENSPYASALSGAAIGEAKAKPRPIDPNPCSNTSCSEANGYCFSYAASGTNCFGGGGLGCWNQSCP